MINVYFVYKKWRTKFSFCVLAYSGLKLRTKYAKILRVGWNRQLDRNQPQEGIWKRASLGRFLEWNIGERAGRHTLDTRNEWKGWISVKHPRHEKPDPGDFKQGMLGHHAALWGITVRYRVIWKQKWYRKQEMGVWGSGGGVGET